MDSHGFFKEFMKKRSAGIPLGISSICSSNSFVLQAAIEWAKSNKRLLLVEATANQVNQFGGYTSMRPADFSKYVTGLANDYGLPRDHLMLGGDHLGPLVWASKPENEAMNLAEELIAEYVIAGFDKIHIDTSMCLGSDSLTTPLEDFVIAKRGAQLCKIAELAHAECVKNGTRIYPPVYVIGSEVPTPGGSQHKIESLNVTAPYACKASVDTFRKAFYEEGLKDAWDRVIAFVVQPGVEFTSDSVFLYNSDSAKPLCDLLKNMPGMVFEGHSTDYQTPECLRSMVLDGIAILKVGPALTFTMREALMNLEQIEKVLFQDTDKDLSDFTNTLEKIMLKNPFNWEKHYRKDDRENRIECKYSFFDRARYYMQHPEVEKAIQRLQDNLDHFDIPLPLLSQFMPIQYKKAVCGQLNPRVDDLLIDSIRERLSDYDFTIRT